jgi:hypothetical protein
MLSHSHAVATSAGASLADDDRALVTDLVRYLDRVAFVPRDLALAYAQGQLEADVFDRYRATCEHATGRIRDDVWLAVIDALCARAVALTIRI